MRDVGGRDVIGNRDDLDPQRREFTCRRLQRILAPRTDDEVRPLGRERKSSSAAETFLGRGYEGDAPFEAKVHPSILALVYEWTCLGEKSGSH